MFKSSVINFVVYLVTYSFVCFSFDGVGVAEEVPPREAELYEFNNCTKGLGKFYFWLLEKKYDFKKGSCSYVSSIKVLWMMDD